MWKWLGLIAVLGATFAARVYGITHESVWYDEAVSVCLLDKPTLSEFLAENRHIDAFKFPLYFVVEYAWWHAIGPSVTGLRILTILFSLATVALLYWYSFRKWGAWVALTACLYFALSKQFIFYGQEIRMYTPMYLIALGSWFALHEAALGNRKAWWANGALNLLLVQTHMLAVFNFAAQGLFLLLEKPRAWRRLIVWSVAHGLFVATVIPWIMILDPYEVAMLWIPTPTIMTLLKTWFLVYPAASLDDGYPLPIVHTWPALAVAALAAPIAILGFLKLLRTPSAKPAALLLACWLIVPPFLMFAASYVKQPCYVDRYVLYAAFPFFIFTGLGVASLRANIRWIAASVLAALCAFNAYTIARPMRPDIATATDFVRINLQPGDRIVVHGMGYEFCVRVYLPDSDDYPVPVKLRPKHSLRDVAQGKRTWYLIALNDMNHRKWLEQIDEALSNGRVQKKMEYITSPPQPIRVMLLAPASGKRGNKGANGAG